MRWMSKTLCFLWLTIAVAGANVAADQPAPLPVPAQPPASPECLPGFTLSSPYGLSHWMVLSVHHAIDGVLSNAVIVQSSNDLVHDAAAVRCLNTMHLPPLTWQHQPIATDWYVKFQWQTGADGKARSFWFPPIQGRLMNTCSNVGQIQKLVDDHEKHSVTIATEIGGDGSVHNPVVTQSSGIPGVDELTKACALEWHYYPVSRDGKPASIDWSNTLIWRRTD